MSNWKWIASVCAALIAGFAGGYLLAGDRQKAESSSGLAEIRLNAPYAAAPDELAVFPCTRRTRFDDPYASCLLVMAGGKRLVFGAPVGQDWRGIGHVDGVFLFDGHPISMGGLAGIRNRSWWAGRKTGLLVIGGELLLDEIKTLDEAQSRGDALAALEAETPVDFLDANLRPKPVPAMAEHFRVFDTGDLRVFANSKITGQGNQVLTFEVVYAGQSTFVQPCGGKANLSEGDSLILPVSDRAPLVEAQRQARIARQDDLVRDYQRIGESCLSSAQAISFGEAQKLAQLVLIRPDRDTDTPLKQSTLPVKSLDSEKGLVLQKGASLGDDGAR